MDDKNQIKINDFPKILSKCPNCGNTLDRINYTQNRTEQWLWNGSNWECCADHSLITDPEQSVLCPECDTTVGTGLEFGFTPVIRF